MRRLAGMISARTQAALAAARARGTKIGGRRVRSSDGEPVERLFCPTHGNVMNLEEARRAVFEENRDDIIDKARNVARDLLRDAFKK